MGTNFYKGNGKHIGKRSAAGSYCWSCNMTLREGGEDLVHQSSRHFAKNGFGFTDSDINKGWHKSCPVCGEKRTNDTNAALIELGFEEPNNDNSKKRTGVQSCSSFNYARSQAELSKYLKRVWNKKVIKDEYGRKFTGKEFDEMIRNNCPIKITKHIGVEFS